MPAPIQRHIARHRAAKAVWSVIVSLDRHNGPRAASAMAFDAFLSLIPLAYASAIVRYRLADVEVIVKRALVYAAALAAILGIYSLLLRFASDAVFDGGQHNNRVIALLATLVVVLLASPVKNAIQAALDRAFYRDRYDYRRALVGFARDLNSDLDLERLGERLIARITETLLVDRMMILVANEQTGDFEPLRTAGFAVAPPGVKGSLGLNW